MPGPSTTPILDLEQELPPQRKRSWTRTIVVYSIVLLVLVAINIAWELNASDTPDLPDVHTFNGWLLLPALYFAILMHELGHLAAGKLAGMNPGGICVGGIIFIKSGERWVVRFQLKYLFGGFAVPIPSKLDFQAGLDFQRARHAWMTAGGPLASLLLTVLCGLAVLAFGDGAGQWIATLFSAGVLTLVSSIIPYKVGPNMSDGARLWQLFRNPERARRWMAVVGLQAENMRGVRPRDWTAEVVEQALETGESEPSYTVIQLLAGYRSRDQGDQEGGLQRLDNALAAASRNGNRTILRGCFLEAAYMSAKQRRNLAQARVWMERAAALKVRGTPGDTAGLEAQIAMAEERFADAVDHRARYRNLIAKKRLDSGIMRYAKDNLAEAESECRAALAKPALSLPTSAL